uniref:Aminotransferase class I/classII large domain-containing protein n=1 Tax=Compsopogon caeruleus TaxID=31354 RepID=A0A7S1XGN3_9RHOD|mmetsp:Transcript_7577/g.15399  ORF Transcript_7577/g.15399 Transcript_7577/m.15399 type:complete len:505 (+) Transcript_7577:991-2505(+)
MGRWLWLTPRGCTVGSFGIRWASGSSPVPAPGSKVLTGSGINANVRNMEYAVRGKLVQRADEISRQLRMGSGSFPFSQVVYCNIGNPQSLKQQPLTFVRQVLAGCLYPTIRESLPKDAAERVKQMLDATNGAGLGAYSESKGVGIIREHVAEFIERRDGHPADPNQIYLTNGASDAVKGVLSMLIRNTRDAVLVPIPQYPLYSASLTLFGGRLEGYFLNESSEWGIDIRQLRHLIQRSQSKGYQVRGLVVINPGNPTGQLLSEDNMRKIVRLCEQERLVLLADEVYQENVYVENPSFVSFKKVVRNMGSNVELASFHSTSKGIFGECGLRGGYTELVNFSPDACENMLKLMSVNLCSSLPGQVALSVMVNPPQPGDVSYEQYTRERTATFESLKRKADKLVAALNTFEGVTCNRSVGAMYAFPRIRLPLRARSYAVNQGLTADQFYALQLLEETGVCVVPGSGFGQEEGTLHFRTTILPPESDMDTVIDSMRTFHARFLERFHD